MTIPLMERGLDYWEFSLSIETDGFAATLSPVAVLVKVETGLDHVLVRAPATVSSTLGQSPGWGWRKRRALGYHGV